MLAQSGPLTNPSLGVRWQTQRTNTPCLLANEQLTLKHNEMQGKSGVLRNTLPIEFTSEHLRLQLKERTYGRRFRFARAKSRGAILGAAIYNRLLCPTLELVFGMVRSKLLHELVIEAQN
jgi:hypothetical protein